VAAELEGPFFYLSLCGFAPEDILTALAAHDRNTMKAREWLYELIATRQFNLDMNTALDQSREEHEVELSRQKEFRDLERKSLSPLFNPEFNCSRLLSDAVRASREFEAWAATEAGGAALVPCLDMELRSAQWYPTSSFYFDLASHRLKAVTKVAPAAAESASDLPAVAMADLGAKMHEEVQRIQSGKQRALTDLYPACSHALLGIKIRRAEKSAVRISRGTRGYPEAVSREHAAGGLQHFGERWLGNFWRAQTRCWR
jgi:hypothetical protein